MRGYEGVAFRLAPSAGIRREIGEERGKSSLYSGGPAFSAPRALLAVPGLAVSGSLIKTARLATKGQ
jgi:hypothetical protein